jgi:hypothetical protein
LWINNYKMLNRLVTKRFDSGIECICSAIEKKSWSNQLFFYIKEKTEVILFWIV